MRGDKQSEGGNRLSSHKEQPVAQGTGHRRSKTDGQHRGEKNKQLQEYESMKSELQRFEANNYAQSRQNNVNHHVINLNSNLAKSA